MKLGMLVLLAPCAAWLVGCGDSTSDADPPVDSQDIHASNEAIKKAAKKAVRNAMALDAKGKFDKVKFKDATDKACYEVIASVDADSVVKKSKALRQLKVRAVGGDVKEARAAIESLCTLAVGGFGATCQTASSDVEVHALSKDTCDRDAIYLGIVGDTKDAEDAIENRHHFDQWHKGKLLLNGADDSSDDITSDMDGTSPFST